MIRLVATAVVLSAVVACGALSSSAVSVVTPGTKDADAPVRVNAIARAQVWTRTNVRAMDIRRGPTGPGAFPFRATLTCDYLPKELAGGSPKFACQSKNDELKVKFGGTNAEVFGEVAATRLLWALGFGADRMYSVRVICRGCPTVLAGIPREKNETLFDPATIERKSPGREFEPDSSWSWNELDAVDPKRGAPLAHRDALKLLAVFLQHTDSKPQQQRLMCLDASAQAEGPTTVCARPFMMVSDVGLTFGRANLLNTNSKGMNFVQWAATPIWKDDVTCTGDLPKSATGTLNNPVISEAGRAFLANLLMQLTDAQIRALFEAARVDLRLRDPEKAKSGFATVGEWTDVFKRKRTEIVERRCA